jgi:NAD(P)-dependent dehydrogenase (short-subunit alcohol dehydrogenase family)
MSAGTEKQVAVVTGGAGGESGLGLTTAEALLRTGVHVAVWDNDLAAIERARAELHNVRLAAYFQEVDVTDPERVHDAHLRLQDELGPVSILVNNAAIKASYVNRRAPDGSRPLLLPFWQMDLSRFRRAWEVNVIGPLITMSEIVPAMLARGRGSIINVVTSPHTQRSPRHIPYGPSKAMLETLTQGVAAQLSALGKGVRANAILPGASANRRRAHKLDPDRPPYDCLVPIILWLISDEAANVNGQIFASTEFKRPHPA